MTKHHVRLEKLHRRLIPEGRTTLITITLLDGATIWGRVDVAFDQQRTPEID